MGQVVDITGQRYGRLIAQRYCGVKNAGTTWECRCDCGKITLARSNDLRMGKQKSCGCLRLEESRKATFKHGLQKTPEYRAWQGAKTRCYNPSREMYSRYGGRGIMMCERWEHNFLNFLHDMGKRPSKRHSLDRRDNDGNYEPTNCRWATPRQQGNNKTHGRALRKLTDKQVIEIKKLLNSNTKSLREIADLHGVQRCTIYDIQRGRTWKEESLDGKKR